MKKDCSVELNALLALWAGVGFGQGWRVPRVLHLPLARKFGEPTKYLRLIGRMLFDQTGAFPTTSVLDAFTRADEDPVSNSGKWTSGITGNAGLSVISNTLGHASSGNHESYWNVADFGPDSEVYVTVSTSGASSDEIMLYLRMVNIGAGSTDCYRFYQQASGFGKFEALTDGNAGSPIGSENNGSTYSTGDSFGFEMIGTTLKSYKKPSGGSWAQTGSSATDGTFTAAGKIGIRIQNSTWRVDDFGGGTVVPVEFNSSKASILNVGWWL